MLSGLQDVLGASVKLEEWLRLQSVKNTRQVFADDLRSQQTPWDQMQPLHKSDGAVSFVLRWQGKGILNEDAQRPVLTAF